MSHEMPNVMRNIILLKEDCGEVCDTSDNFERKPGKYFDVIKKEIECDILLTSPTMNPPLLTGRVCNMVLEKPKPPRIKPKITWFVPPELRV